MFESMMIVANMSPEAFRRYLVPAFFLVGALGVLLAVAAGAFREGRAQRRFRAELLEKEDASRQAWQEAQARYEAMAAKDRGNLNQQYMESVSRHEQLMAFWKEAEDQKRAHNEKIESQLDEIIELLKTPNRA